MKKLLRILYLCILMPLTLLALIIGVLLALYSYLAGVSEDFQDRTFIHLDNILNKKK